MATLPLIFSTALSGGVPQQLLSQLEPNTPPAEPSAWPLAPGYWLVLMAVLVMACLIAYLWYRGRHWRHIQQHLARIKRLAEPNAELHQLLRWLLITHLSAPKSMDEQALAEKITATLGTLPEWVNGHYQADKSSDINWAEVKTLLQHWKKEARL
ncbi:DUF4381 domain-containing protein [Reinekea marinisedimentorum]|uniref:Uncharacterized protein DUF4381 n=1 Tax=Reinekea marinisedimentorum TaxID=230495 RepID=A0A4V2UJL8_9GAMM|nr:DUF4381 domain-containing protein [Reinekea marinisedimentorum]TCS40649.1 uncharacterized protein DUF4381 [Reinekea marinisedimentorum]